ncbi:metallophosphoesterase family protein [Thalassolituus sp. UBA3500]|uniref:metallophosphoesterase family protein n=1 Tax=Thalassolituus sp. UBA3500 TaxID=1947664 RepID=UPI000C10724F|nr:metallophosphoesterase [Thalassolituus sp. UBA3500]MBN57554.1 hypothetical protein [Oceanospirillaceae bacterium]|tara:strand:- start:15061 stop:16248 length:1188 start_codon:yes stop_codon:yes gene_type:complete
MNDNGMLNLLVFSDLHMENSGSSQDTRLLTEDDEFSKSILEKISELDVNLDYVVCSGDISNKSSPVGFDVGWKFVKDVADYSRVARENLIVVPGNHDHDSRLNNSHCPKYNLQFSVDDFPFPNKVDNTHFWAWNWAHKEYEEFNLISVNSSAFHGYGDEWKHGRVPNRTADQIRDYMKSEAVRKKKFNLLVTHHHPFRMDYVDQEEDYEAIDGGEYLIEAVQNSRKGPWLIVHGHKHFPDIKYGPSRGASRPVVFSAGSLSAKLYPKIKDRTTNQFYVLSVDLDATAKNGGVTGEFRTYEWTMTSGWRLSEGNSLPERGGFGSALKSMEIIEEVAKIFENSSKRIAKDSEIKHLNSYLKHLMPEDLEVLVAEFKDEGYIADISGNEFKEIGVSNG